jgi:hypothetical protein
MKVTPHQEGALLLGKVRHLKLSYGVLLILNASKGEN